MVVIIATRKYGSSSFSIRSFHHFSSAFCCHCHRLFMQQIFIKQVLGLGTVLGDGVRAVSEIFKTSPHMTLTSWCGGQTINQISQITMGGAKCYEGKKKTGDVIQRAWEVCEQTFILLNHHY